jgi:hypothetical protein
VDGSNDDTGRSKKDMWNIKKEKVVTMGIQRRKQVKKPGKRTPGKRTKTSRKEKKGQRMP